MTDFKENDSPRGDAASKESGNSRSNRDDSTRSTTSDAPYKAFAKDKRERPQVPGHTSDQRRDSSAKPSQYKSRDYPADGERQPYHKQYSAGGQRRQYTPRSNDNRNNSSRNGEKNDGEGQRRSYNPNFDSSNRPVGGGAQGGGYRNREDFRESGTSREDYRNQGDRYNSGSRSEGHRGGYNNKGYNKDYSKSGSRSYGDRPNLADGSRPERSGCQAGRRDDFRGNKQGGTYQARKPKPRYDAEHYPTYSAPKPVEDIRLNRYIAMSGLCSRREADDIIRSGVVTVNKEVITEMGYKVSPGDVVKVNDERIINEKKVYILMNKPKGFVTSVDDPHADKTVMDIVRNACRERIYPVGRLDKNSVGVLLLTNDGELTKKLTHPSYEKKKIYQVTLDRPLTRADMEAIAEGITLEDGEIHADAVSYVEDSKTEIGIEIHSGRNRIVRRIFEHFGYRVTKLDRVYFAGLTKKKLKRGEWRFLTKREVDALRSGLYE